MAPPSKRWPENAEYARQDSCTKIREIRSAIINVSQHTNELYTLKILQDALIKTYEVETLLNSVGAKAENDQRSMGY